MRGFGFDPAPPLAGTGLQIFPLPLTFISQFLSFISLLVVVRILRNILILVFSAGKERL